MAADAAKTLTFRRAPWTPEAVEQLQAAEAFDTTGGLESIEAYARMGIAMFEGIDDAGEVLARYVVEVQTGPHGVRNVQVVAAAGASPDHTLAEAIMAAAEVQAEMVGAHWVSYHTMRPGLVRKGERQGYTVHGWVMRKRIGAAQ